MKAKVFVIALLMSMLMLSASVSAFHWGNYCYSQSFSDSDPSTESTFMVTHYSSTVNTEVNLAPGTNIETLQGGYVVYEGDNGILVRLTEYRGFVKVVDSGFWASVYGKYRGYRVGRSSDVQRTGGRITTC